MNSSEKSKTVWLSALASNGVYLQNLWQSSFSEFGNGFFTKTHPQKLDSKELELFLFETFATSLVFDKNTKTVFSTEKGIDSIQIVHHKLDDHNSLSLATFRGTEPDYQPSNFKSILNYLSYKYPSFEDSWKNIEPLTNQLLEQNQPRSGNHHVLFTGHSYGGALAGHAARAYNGNPSMNTKAITFGSPGMGKSVWVRTNSAILNITQMALKIASDKLIQSSMKELTNSWVGKLLNKQGTGLKNLMPPEENLPVLNIINPQDPVPKIGTFALNKHHGFVQKIHNRYFEKAKSLTEQHSMGNYLKGLTEDIYARVSSISSSEAQENLILQDPIERFAMQVAQKAHQLTKITMENMAQTEAQAFKNLAHLDDPAQQKEGARQAAVHGALSFARILLQKGGSTAFEKIPPIETPNNWSDVVLESLQDEVSQASLKSALQAFRVKKEMFNPTPNTGEAIVKFKS